MKYDFIIQGPTAKQLEDDGYFMNVSKKAKDNDMIDTIKEAIKDQIDANETMVKTINKIVNNMNTQRELIEMQDKINKKLIQDIQDIKHELQLNKIGANKKWQA